MFRMDPFFDDANIQLDLEDIQSQLDRAHIDLQMSIEGFEGIPRDISHRLKQFIEPVPKQLLL